MKKTALVCILIMLLSTTAMAAKPVTLRLFSPYFTEEPTGTLLRELVATWNGENPDIQIEVIAVPHSDRETKFRSLMMANQGPDIVAVPPGSLDNYYTSGYLLNLEPLIAATGGDGYKAQFTEVAQKAVSVDNDWYALPTWGGIHALYYNIDLFEQAGLDPNNPPETWSEFLEAAKILTTGDQYGYGMYGYRNEVSIRELLPWLVSNGTQLFNDDMTKATFADEKGIEAFTFFVELATKHNVVPPGVTTAGYNEVSLMFANEQVAMYQNAQWGRSKAHHDNPNIEGKFLVAPIPRPDNAESSAAVYVSVANAITTQCKQPEAAWKFLNYYTNDENLIRRNEVMGFLPARKAAAANPRVVGDPFIKGFIDLFPIANMRPRHARIQEINLALADALQAALLGIKTPEQALKDAELEVNGILRGN